MFCTSVKNAAKSHHNRLIAALYYGVLKALRICVSYSIPLTAVLVLFEIVVTTAAVRRSAASTPANGIKLRAMKRS